MAEGRRVVLAGEVLDVVVEDPYQTGELGEEDDLAKRTKAAERRQIRDPVAASVLLEQLGQVLRLGNGLDEDAGPGPVAEIQPVAAIFPGLAGVLPLKLARDLLGDRLEERLGKIIEREHDHRDALAHQMLHHRFGLGLVLALGAGAEVHGYESVLPRLGLDALHHLEEPFGVVHARGLHRVLGEDGHAQGEKHQQVDPAAVQPCQAHVTAPPRRTIPIRWTTTCGTP